MALTLLVTPVAGDIIQASVWINEFNNIYNNPISLISPLTGTVNLNSQTLSGAATFSGAITFSSTVLFTTLDIGATDTTVSRSAAGIIAVEGIAVPTISSTDSLSNKTLASAVISGAAPSTPTANVLYTDSLVKAWAYVTVSGGSPTLTNDFNVTSVTDNGVGDFTLNFATNLPSANFAAACTAGSLAAGTTSFASPRDLAVGSLRYIVRDDTGAAMDNNSYVVIFGS